MHCCIFLRIIFCFCFLLLFFHSILFVHSTITLQMNTNELYHGNAIGTDQVVWLNFEREKEEEEEEFRVLKMKNYKMPRGKCCKIRAIAYACTFRPLELIKFSWFALYSVLHPYRVSRDVLWFFTRLQSFFFSFSSFFFKLLFYYLYFINFLRSLVSWLAEHCVQHIACNFKNFCFWVANKIELVNMWLIFMSLNGLEANSIILLLFLR